MATLAIGSWFLAGERVVAVALGERVYARTMRARADRAGEALVAPFEAADLGDLDGVTVVCGIDEDVTAGLADLQIEVLCAGGRAARARVWVEHTGGHPPLTFAAALHELRPDDVCPVGTGADVRARLMASARGGRPTAFAVPSVE